MNSTTHIHADGKPGEGTVFFVYRAKVDTGSSMLLHRWRNQRKNSTGQLR